MEKKISNTETSASNTFTEAAPGSCITSLIENHDKIASVHLEKRTDRDRGPEHVLLNHLNTSINSKECFHNCTWQRLRSGVFLQYIFALALLLSVLGLVAVVIYVGTILNLSISFDIPNGLAQSWNSDGGDDTFISGTQTTAGIVLSAEMSIKHASTLAYTANTHISESAELAVIVEHPNFAYTETFSSVNLTINPRNTYDWAHWTVLSSYTVQTLTLQGCLKSSDISYFLSTFLDITSLRLEGIKTAECSKKIWSKTNNITHKNIKNLFVVESSNDVIEYLLKNVEFTSLNSVTFQKSEITLNNIMHYNRFLLFYGSRITSLGMYELNLCNGCELFPRQSNQLKRMFPQLKISTMTFYSESSSTSRCKTLRNFSHESPMIAQFQTNVSCEDIDIRVLLKYWKYIDRSKSKLCE